MLDPAAVVVQRSFKLYCDGEYAYEEEPSTAAVATLTYTDNDTADKNITYKYQHAEVYGTLTPTL